jgi:hypothetical protein
MIDLTPFKQRLEGVSIPLSLGDADFIDVLALERADAEFLKNAVYDVALLVDEVEQLQAHVQRLQTENRVLLDPHQAKLVSFADNTFTFESEVFRVCLAGLVQMLDACEAENYLSLDFGGRTDDAVNVTVQRRNQPTPHQKRQEAEAKLADMKQAYNALADETDRLRAKLAKPAQAPSSLEGAPYLAALKAIEHALSALVAGKPQRAKSLLFMALGAHAGEADWAEFAAYLDAQPLLLKEGPHAQDP